MCIRDSRRPARSDPRRARRTRRAGVTHVKNDLVARAIAAQAKAYAPYSKFNVGAAIQISGQVFEGANVENASYGLAICAERTAIFAAVTSGARTLEAVAVCTMSSPPSSPCGACRQVLLEFAPDPTKVIVTSVN